MSDRLQHRRWRWDQPCHQVEDRVRAGTAPKPNYPVGHRPAQCAGARPEDKVVMLANVIEGLQECHTRRR